MINRLIDLTLVATFGYFSYHLYQACPSWQELENNFWHIVNNIL